jgi:hypothetical protein
MTVKYTSECSSVGAPHKTELYCRKLEISACNDSVRRVQLSHNRKRKMPISVPIAPQLYNQIDTY